MPGEDSETYAAPFRQLQNVDLLGVLAALDIAVAAAAAAAAAGYAVVSADRPRSSVAVDPS